MDKQGVGMDMWTSWQNAQLDHIPTPPTRAYPQGQALRPDALRLPNSDLKNPKSQGEITKKGSQNQACQKVDNLAVLPGGI